VGEAEPCAEAPQAAIAALMQQGLWAEAEEALAALDGPTAAPELAELRALLALHRAAEGAWADERRDWWRPLLTGRVLPGLAIANILLYAALGVVRLLAQQ